MTCIILPCRTVVAGEGRGGVGSRRRKRSRVTWRYRYRPLGNLRECNRDSEFIVTVEQVQRELTETTDSNWRVAEENEQCVDCDSFECEERLSRGRKSQMIYRNDTYDPELTHISGKSRENSTREHCGERRRFDRS